MEKADCDENQFYYYAVLSYIKLGLLDSAKYVFSITPAPEDKVDSMNYYNIKSEFDKIEKRPDLSAANALNSAVWENRIMSSSKEKKLLKLEHEFEKQQIKKDKAVLTKQNSLLLTFALIASAILILLFVLLKLLQSNYRKRLHELEMDRENLKSSLAELEHQKKTSTADVSKYVGYRISAINELYQAIRVRKQDDHSSKKTVIPLSALIKELNENSILLKLILKESFWEKLKLSVDGEYNGIVSFVEQRFTNLNENDVKLFCLLCANIPPQIIKLCMNYTNSKTSSTYRNRLIRKKMGLEMTFDDFIEKYMKGYFNC